MSDVLDAIQKAREAQMKHDTRIPVQLGIPNKFRIVWPDGDVYEEDGEREFSEAKCRSVLKCLEGTIAGDAKIVPAYVEEVE